MSDQDKKTQFLKSYWSVPLESRGEVLVVIDDEPLSWKAAKLEVDEDTAKGQQILQILTKLKILP